MCKESVVFNILQMQAMRAKNPNSQIVHDAFRAIKLGNKSEHEEYLSKIYQNNLRFTN